jgi:hypothetical protein
LPLEDRKGVLAAALREIGFSQISGGADSTLPRWRISAKISRKREVEVIFSKDQVPVLPKVSNIDCAYL